MASPDPDTIYREYVSSIPANKLNNKLDFEHGNLDVHLVEIAHSMINWTVNLATPLGLTAVDVHTITADNQNQAILQQQAALRLWKNKNGPIATYDRLLRIFVNAGRNDCADILCRLLGAGTARQNISHDPTPRHHIVGFPSESAPTLPQIISVSLPDGSTVNLSQQIGTHYNLFGIMLLNDETGARISAIETQHLKNAQEINLEVFKSWIKGEGRKPASWNTLVTVLREIKLNALADKINSTLN